MTKVRFLPAAEIELLREVAYYSKARAGTGVRFNAAVLAAVSRVAHHPRGGAPSYLDTRSTLVKGFPFSVVYRVLDGDVLVVASPPIACAPTTGRRV